MTRTTIALGDFNGEIIHQQIMATGRRPLPFIEKLIARVERLIFGAYDPKAGFCGSLGNLVQDSRLNHRLEVIGGFEGERARLLLQRFFQELRKRPTETERWQSG